VLASDEDGAGDGFRRVPKEVSDIAEDGRDRPGSRGVLEQRLDRKAGSQIGMGMVPTHLSAGQDWPQHLLARTLVPYSSRFLPVGMTVACLWNEDGHTHDSR
jgi:hypothetical protein